MDTRTQHLLRQKGNNVLTTTPDTTVYDCIETMVDHNVGSIIVMDGDTLAGIFTERDYLRRIVLQGRTSKTTQVKEVMTTEVITVDPDTSLEKCLSIMTEARCRHLPVLSEGRLVGIVSIGDCVKQLFKTAKDEVDTLQNYVTGRYPA